MGLSTLSFLTEEAAKSIRRNGLMSLASLTTVVVAMTVLGGALFALFRLHQLAESQPRQFEVAVFLAPDADEEEVKSVQRRIQALPSVERVTLYPKNQALADLEKSDQTDGTGITAALEGENPLPDRLDVRLTDPRKTSHLTAVLSDRARFPEIKKVRDERETVDMLYSMERVIKTVGGVAGTLLVLATALVIQNTLRLTVLARRREIRVMQLVGATPGFIRLPLVLEGIFYGVVGSALASGLVLLIVHQVTQFAGRFFSPLAGNLPESIEPWYVVGILVVMGTFIGWLGSVLSIRRFLKRL